ncbi:MAG: 6-phosphofructokinase [Ruminococcaceae bacterium]|nr:6-phosphofructokinase [Oscillospiraceae bacterium]
MANILKGAAVVGQSGGPTAAINATLSGVIKGFFESNGAVTKLYGMRNGIEGFIGERLCDLGEMFADSEGKLDTEKLDMLVSTPAAALGSCRKKLPKPQDDPAFFENLIALFKKYDIRYFFYIGGNDSMDTVAKLTEYLRTSDYEMRVMGVPKTIDNDLAGTDHTPGFGSAAKFIATTMQEIIRDCAVYTTKAVTIVEIMGRDAGWLTAAAALPRVITGVEPDYVYLPEAPFSMEGFYRDIEAAFEKHPNIVIAVSEGARFADGRYVGEGTQSGATDVFGHKYLEGTGKALENAVKEHFGCKVRSIELNLPQRCAAHLTSGTDLTESQNCGKTAVLSAVSGTSGCMIAMIREDGEEYKISYVPSDVTKIANAVRDVPRSFINEEGNNVTDECLNYIKPLIAGETKLFFKDGLPVHFIIK